MTKVILLEPTRLNVTALSEWGDVTTLFPAGQRRPSVWSAELREAVLARLEEARFDPASDYVALVGGSAMLAVLLSCVLSVSARATLLAYDPPSGNYVTVQITTERRDVERVS